MAMKIIKDDMPLLLKALLAISRDEVVVGIPADAPARTDGGPPNAVIAYANEYGVPDINMPARPFMGPGIDSAKPEMVSELRSGLVSALKDTASLKGTAGGNSAVRSSLQAVGRIGRDSIRARMKSGAFVPLAPTTIRARRERGNSSIKPLIDTEQLYDAVTFEVRKKS